MMNCHTTPATKFAYVNSTIVQCRLRGIYKQYILQKYDRMIDTLSDTIAVMQYTPDVDIDVHTVDRIMETLKRSRTDFQMKNYKDGNRRLRELYFRLE